MPVLKALIYPCFTLFFIFEIHCRKFSIPTKQYRLKLSDGHFHIIHKFHRNISRTFSVLAACNSVKNELKCDYQNKRRSQYGNQISD